MKLTDLDLLSLQTQFMKADPTTQGLCAALSPQMRHIAENISKCLLWKNYRGLPEEVLDALAVSLNIPWYDSKSDYEVKSYIIEKSDQIRLLQGTKKSIELIFSAWNITAYILEWFNYGGEAYHYKILVDYTYYGRLYDANGEVVHDVNGNEVYTLLDSPFLPDGTLLNKIREFLKLIQPARCVLDEITTVEDVELNTMGDLEEYENMAALQSGFMWDLQYKM